MAKRLLWTPPSPLLPPIHTKRRILHFSSSPLQSNQNISTNAKGYHPFPFSLGGKRCTRRIENSGRRSFSIGIDIILSQQNSFASLPTNKDQRKRGESTGKYQNWCMHQIQTTLLSWMKGGGGRGHIWHVIDGGGNFLTTSKGRIIPHHSYPPPLLLSPMPIPLDLIPCLTLTFSPLHPISEYGGDSKMACTQFWHRPAYWVKNHIQRFWRLGVTTSGILLWLWCTGYNWNNKYEVTGDTVAKGGW